MKMIVPDFNPKTEIQISSLSGKGFYVVQDSDCGRNVICGLRDKIISLDFHLKSKMKTFNSLEELRSEIAGWFNTPYVSLWEFNTEKELVDWLTEN